ncbi:MAG: SdpI family protein [Oscillospiraceae bacterium]|nr:SdpI family protein [Oscillospiraceae bacterium]
MNIWGIILIVVLVMSGIMIAFGLYFSVAGPKKINFVMGYRTPMSMKNLDTWKFGNIYAGKMMWHTGVALLIGSLIALFVVIGSNAAIVRNVGIIIIIIHAIMIIGTVILTEIALRKNFDHQGNYR